MGFETVNAFAGPVVLQRTVQLHRQGLKLHATLEGIRHLGTPSDDLVDPFLDVDERWFHSIGRLGQGSAGCKPQGANVRTHAEW